MAETKRKWYGPVVTEEDAVQAIKDSSNAFFFVAALTAVVAVVMSQYMNLFDVVVMAGLALWLRRGRSRVAAVILLLLVLLQAGVTIANKLGAASSGGTNIILAVFMIISGWRAVQAARLLSKARSAPAHAAPAAGQ